MMIQHMDHGSSIVVIAFSSQPHRYEWGGFLSRIGVKHVLVRDETDNWYQDGISGMGDHPDECINWLHRLDKEKLRVIYLGLSAGGYAALLFNAYTKPHRTVAISPATGSGKLPDFDSKWDHRLNGRPNFRPVADLASIYINQNVDNVRTIISDGEGTELDRQMCTRIGSSPFVIPGFGHVGIARYVATSGYLESLIK